MKFPNDFQFSFGYFGKLPGFPDFIKYNAGRSEVSVFDKWLQEGIYYSKQKLRTDWNSFYRNSKAQHFIFPFTGSENFIAGILFPSRDKSGRDFPFMLFAYLNKIILNHYPFYILPLILQEMFEHLEQLYLESNSLESLNPLDEKINQFKSELNSEQIMREYENYLSNTLHENFWERTLGDFNDERKFFIINNLHTVKSSAAGLKYNFISDENNKTLDFCFFLHLISKCKTKFLPAVFWSFEENSRTSVNIFSNKLIPLNYLDIIYNKETSERVMELEANYGHDFLYGSTKKLLEKKELNINELLNINF